jgi:hypothetical protein
MQCTSCLCDWTPEGFYTQDGAIVQPCKVCRCDSSSVYYLNNHARIREQQRESYYSNLEAKRAYMRDYMRNRRAAATV